MAPPVGMQVIGGLIVYIEQKRVWQLCMLCRTEIPVSLNFNASVPYEGEPERSPVHKYSKQGCFGAAHEAITHQMLASRLTTNRSVPG